jgi:hypothetical protein
MTKSKIFEGRRRSLIDSPLWPSTVEEMHGISPECADDYHHECLERLKRMMVNSILTCDCWCHGRRRGRKRGKGKGGKEEGGSAAAVVHASGVVSQDQTRGNDDSDYTRIACSQYRNHTRSVLTRRMSLIT